MRTGLSVRISGGRRDLDFDNVSCGTRGQHEERAVGWVVLALTKGTEGLEEDGLVDVVGDVADEDGFLGLGSFLHRCRAGLGTRASGKAAVCDRGNEILTLTISVTDDAAAGGESPEAPAPSE